MKHLWMGLVVILAFSAVVRAADTPMTFDSPEQKTRYEGLLEELRCLVCQNQSLADSHAELAQDLRDEVYAMVTDGRDDEQIVEFMVARYGDFVRYKPPIKSTTWLLWFGPFALLLLALLIVRLTVRAKPTESQPLTAEEKAQLNSLISSERD